MTKTPALLAFDYDAELAPEQVKGLQWFYPTKQMCVYYRIASISRQGLLRLRQFIVWIRHTKPLELIESLQQFILCSCVWYICICEASDHERKDVLQLCKVILAMHWFSLYSIQSLSPCKTKFIQGPAVVAVSSCHIAAGLFGRLRTQQQCPGHLERRVPMYAPERITC